MKSRIVYWLCVVLAPCIAYAALIYGYQFDGNLGGVLLQVLGGVIGLGWTTWMFLEIAQAATRLFRVAPSETSQAQLDSGDSHSPPSRPRRAA